MKILLSQAIWGEKYVDIFLKYSYSSLMASGNLIQVAKNHQITLDLYTTKKDYEILIKKLSKFEKEIGEIRCTFIEELGYKKKNIPGEVGNQKYTFLTELQNEALKNSDDYDYIIFNYSDFIWTNESLSNVIDLLDNKTDAILGFCLPVDKQKCIESINRDKNKYYVDDVLEIENKKSVELALNNLHRETRLRYWESANFTAFPSYLIWNIPDEGIVLRAYHQTILALKTKLHYLKEGISGQGSLDGYISSLVAQFGNYKIADDSNKIFIYSLYETGLDSLAFPWTTREESLVRCLVQYITVPQRELAKIPIKIQKNNINKENWEEVINKSLEDISVLHDAAEFNSTLYIKKNKPEVISVINNSSIKNIFNYVKYKTYTYTKLLSNSKIIDILLFKFVSYPYVGKKIRIIDLYIKNINPYRARRYIEKRTGIYELRMRILNRITEYYKNLFKINNKVVYGNRIECVHEDLKNENIHGAWQKIGIKDWHGHIDGLDKEPSSNKIASNASEITINISPDDVNIHLGYRISAENCKVFFEADTYEFTGNIYLFKSAKVDILAHIIVPFKTDIYSDYDDFTDLFSISSIKIDESEANNTLKIYQGQIWTKFSFYTRGLKSRIDLTKGMQISLKIKILDKTENKIILKDIRLFPEKIKNNFFIYGIGDEVKESVNIIERARTRAIYPLNINSIEILLRKIIIVINYLVNVNLITNYNEDKDNNFSKYIVKKLNNLIYENKKIKLSLNDKDAISKYCKNLAEWMLKVNPEDFQYYNVLAKINLISGDFMSALENYDKYKLAKESYIYNHYNGKKIDYITFHVEKGYESDFLNSIIGLIKNKILSADNRKYLVVFEIKCYEYEIIKLLFSSYIYLYLEPELTVSDWTIIKHSKIIWQIEIMPGFRHTDKNLMYTIGDIETAWSLKNKNQTIINYKFQNHGIFKTNNFKIVVCIDSTKQQNQFFITEINRLLSQEIYYIYINCNDYSNSEFISNKLILDKNTNLIQSLEAVVSCDLIISDDIFFNQVAKEYNRNIIEFQYTKNVIAECINIIDVMLSNYRSSNESMHNSIHKILDEDTIKVFPNNRLLDIVVPTYNRPIYLYKLLSNFVELNCSNIYLYIIDDGSDLYEYINNIGYLNTKDVCNYFKNKNVLYFRKNDNLGVADAWKDYFSSENIANYAMFLRDKDQIISLEPILEAVKKLETDSSLAIVILPIEKIDRIDNQLTTMKNYPKMAYLDFLKVYIDDEILQHCSMGGGGIYRTSEAIIKNIPSSLGLNKFGLDDAFGIDFDFLMTLIHGKNIDFVNKPSIRWVSGGGATEKFPLSFAYCYYQYVNKIFTTIYVNSKENKKIKRKFIKFWILLMIRGHYVTLNPVHGTEAEIGTSRVKYHLNKSFYLFILYELLCNRIIPNLEMTRLLLGSYLFENNSSLLPKFNTLVYRLIYKN
jgi:hypothetical protein